jgi:hypothetical protein
LAVFDESMAFSISGRRTDRETGKNDRGWQGRSFHKKLPRYRRSLKMTHPLALKIDPTRIPDFGLATGIERSSGRLFSEAGRATE